MPARCFAPATRKWHATHRLFRARRGATLSPDRAFLIGPDSVYTFAQARQRIDDTARGLYAAGFALGDSVAVYSPNEPIAVIAVFAAMRAGGAWIPVAGVDTQNSGHPQTPWPHRTARG